MTIQQIERILEQHNIKYKNGQQGEWPTIQAVDTSVDIKTGEYIEELVDVTDWSIKQMYQWLGY